MEALTLCHDPVKTDKTRSSPNVTSSAIFIKVLNCPFLNEEIGCALTYLVYADMLGINQDYFRLPKHTL